MAIAYPYSQGAICALAQTQYSRTQISVQIPLVIPAEAGIQAVFWIPAKRMPVDRLAVNGHFILWSCTQ
jgi:hypothetical protein